MIYKSSFSVDGANCTREDSRLSDLFSALDMFVNLGFSVAHVHIQVCPKFSPAV